MTRSVPEVRGRLQSRLLIVYTIYGSTYYVIYELIMVDKRAVVVCGAIAGGLIGAGYILWRITKGRHSHHHSHGHRHGPDFNSEDAVDMWIDSQFGKESEFFDFSFSPKEAIDYSMKVVELCCKHKKVRI